ncbi:transcriptional repressor [Sphingomonas sp. HHU CXW]|jgi:Fur family zinc uptake transcriptional regulator|uniref:Transcriptional repressor n=1 Tax=Sphingomonas hominis TaxID=2741495 RepID=A0ABX2JDT2_9SPHN|nr:transcriptional repressor [Sphingomonas hominis]NTS64580.1 transcriptional repressor [Sphingomonas hominis]
MIHAAHQHQEPEGGALADAARVALQDAGEQWTPMRAQVFDVLASFAKPASAYDLAEHLSRAQGRRIAANSIYRILDLFVAANVAQRVESQNAYVANVHPGCRHDCIFLVCDQCGAADHVDDDKIASSIRHAAEGSGFAPTRPVIEVRGTCQRCRERT